MANEEIGSLKAKVGLNSTEFNQGIKILSTQLKIAQEDFKAASAGLDKVKDSMQLAQLKYNTLTSQIATQSKIVDQMRQAHKNASDQFGVDSKKATEYELSLKKSETALAGLQSQLVKTQAELKKTGTTTAEVAEKFKALGVTWQSVGQKLSGIGTAMTIGLTAPISAAGVAGLKFNATMEDLTANFETMLGSAEAAKVMLADITSFAKATPFEMTGLANASKILLNFGVSAQEIMPTIKMLGDVSLGNQEKFDRLTLAFGQIQATGRLMGQDLNQLVQSGFNPLKIISDQTGRSMSSLKKDMEKGAISADMVTEAFKIATSEGGLFYNAMEKGSKTFNGQMSTLKDTINITLGQSLKPLFEELSKNILPKIISSVEKMGKAFAALNGEQQLNIVKTAAMVAVMGPLLVVVGKLIAAIPALVSGFNALKVASAFLLTSPIGIAITAITATIVTLTAAAMYGASAIRNMKAELIQLYVAEGEQQKASIDKAHSARIDAINKELSDADKASSQRMALIQKEFDAHSKGSAKQSQALKKDLQERKTLLEENHRNAIQRIQDEYGVFEEKTNSKTDIVRNQLEEEIKLLEDTHDEKMRLLDEEYEAKLKSLDTETLKVIRELEDQIDAIDGKTKEEQRLEKQTKDKERIASLQSRILAETDKDKKIELQNELQTELTRIAREALLEQRENEKEVLRQKIVEEKLASEKKEKELSAEKIKKQKELDETLKVEKKAANDLADEKIKAIQKERIAKEEAENKKYNAAKKSIDSEQKRLDEYSGSGGGYSSALQKQLDEKIRIEEEKLAATKKRLKAELEAEQATIEKEKKAVDAATKQKLETVNYYSLLEQLKIAKSQAAAGVRGQEYHVIELTSDIAKEKQRLHNLGIPGFATGVMNWKGGIARINENGGEIVNLPNGSNVIPNDISKQIANAIGNSIGTGGTANVQIFLDGKMIAQAIAPYQQQLSRTRARGQGVTT